MDNHHQPEDEDRRQMKEAMDNTINMWAKERRE
jgi:hypothetical protein